MRPSVLLAVALIAGTVLADEAPRVAGVDVPVPKRMKFTMPDYPSEAQAQGVRGIVILDVVIDTQGHVASAEVVRSIPTLDEAALAAVRKWEYEVTRVDGKPVPVRLTVPITFALKLPEVTRQDGIPELRQGATPHFPPAGRDAGSVTLELTLEPDGRVAEVQLRTGDPVFTQSLLQAVRTWRFAPTDDGAVLSFRVQADFVPPAKGAPARVNLQLTGLHRSEPVASSEPTPPPAAPPASEPPATTAAAAAVITAAAPTPTPSPLASPSPMMPSPPSPPLAPPSSVSASPPAPPTLPPVPAPAPAKPTPPPTEVISAPSPAPVATPPPMGVSGVTDVALDAGVPDLVRGRRPIVPPMARMANVSGTVEVRFSVDASGQTLVRSVGGPDVLKPAAEQTVASWVFRRVSTDRLWLTAEIVYGGVTARARVMPAPAE